MCCVFTVVYVDTDRFYTGINIYSRQQNILITVIKSEWRNCCGVAKCGCRFMCVCSRSTYIKIGTIQRRLAWPLRKDDTQYREAFQIFFFLLLSLTFGTSYWLFIYVCKLMTSIVGSVVEFSPATRETGVRFPDNAILFHVKKVCRIKFC